MTDDVLANAVRKRWHAAGSAQFRREKIAWILVVVVVIESVGLAYAASNPNHHVVQVMPDGESAFVEDPLGNIAPRDVEILYTARRFVKGFYGWSGSDIAVDMQDALEICEIGLRDRLLNDLKKSEILDRAQKDLSGLWSVVRIVDEKVQEKQGHGATVHIDAAISRFHPNISESKPLEEFRVELAIDVRYRRRSITHPSGVEIIGISDRNAGVLGKDFR